MGNFDTINAITDNLEAVLKGQGINFDRKTYDDLKQVPASSLPLGEIRYSGETFEYNFGEKPKYAEAEFDMKVILSASDPRDMMLTQQKWTHLIRDALTIAALNIGVLASSQLISRVTTVRVSMDNSRTDGIAAVDYRVSVRYREV